MHAHMHIHMHTHMHAYTQHTYLHTHTHLTGLDHVFFYTGNIVVDEATQMHTHRTDKHTEMHRQTQRAKNSTFCGMSPCSLYSLTSVCCLCVCCSVRLDTSTASPGPQTNSLVNKAWWNSTKSCVDKNTIILHWLDFIWKHHHSHIM